MQNDQTPKTTDSVWMPVEKHYVYHADCVKLMRSWAGAFRPDFIFADPPFNIGENYDSHDDRMSDAEFKDWTYQWFKCCRDTIKPGGVIAINVPDDMVFRILWCADVFSPALKRIDWCIWHYRFGQCGRSKFISSHTHILIFKRLGDNGDDIQHVFNSDDILVESLRSSQYRDRRTLDSATPGERVPLDVWTDIPRVVGNSRERVVGHPNQLPERYLERLIRAYTNPGNFVFDPFGGTGTTSVVAMKLGRQSATCDVSASYCADINARLVAVNCLNAPFDT